MSLRNTEQQSDFAPGLDTRPPTEILAALHQGQVAAAQSVAAAIPQIEKAAKAAATSIGNGGSLVYAAAGSSALMALADGLELPGTFSVPREQIIIIMAGGPAILSDLIGGPEDDAELARRDIDAARLSHQDCVFCLSASGSTPYAVSALQAANNSGATTVGIANNEAAPLLQYANIPIHLDTPPEIIAGSTRMGAGTSQKIALNMMSTLMAVHLGHIHDGYMVNVQTDNAKLRSRASRIVSSVAGCTGDQATGFLDQADGAVKVAVLLAAGADNTQTAKQLLETNGQKLRPSLSELTRNNGSGQQDV